MRSEPPPPLSKRTVSCYGSDLLQTISGRAPCFVTRKSLPVLASSQRWRRWPPGNSRQLPRLSVTWTIFVRKPGRCGAGVHASGSAGPDAHAGLTAWSQRCRPRLLPVGRLVSRPARDSSSSCRDTSTIFNGTVSASRPSATNPVPVLAEFSARMKIGFPLLSDPGSATIKRYSILNTTVSTSNPTYGIPFPGTIHRRRARRGDIADLRDGLSRRV